MSHSLTVCELRSELLCSLFWMPSACQCMWVPLCPPSVRFQKLSETFSYIQAKKRFAVTEFWSIFEKPCLISQFHLSFVLYWVNNAHACWGLRCWCSGATSGGSECRISPLKRDYITFAEQWRNCLQMAIGQQQRIELPSVSNIVMFHLL